MGPDAETARRHDAALIAALAEIHYQPLWDRFQRLTPLAPNASDGAFHWPWRDIEKLTARAGAEVGLEDAERRAVIMCHPAFDGEIVTTSNLISAFTVLEPGDRAVPHRHTAAAIRFGVRSEGAATIVNGRRCEMLDGDLILTPPMCWHGHINQSDHLTVWFDGANLPLIGELDANFFEPGSRDDDEFWKVDAGAERSWEYPGLSPVSDAFGEAASDESAGPGGGSRKFRYPGADTRAALSALAPDRDGSRMLRYTNPLTGDAVMDTIDCYALRLGAGAETVPRRATHNTICLVAAGEGRSTIGDATIEWSRHDAFSIPHWNWASHIAVGGDADLFLLTDRPVFERLGLWRSEAGGP
jgi:gentisate 1,2-dioxygenase